MGNVLNSKDVQVVLNTPKRSVTVGNTNYYIAGTTVDGAVFITAPRGAKPENIRLNVYFSGVEDVGVHYFEMEVINGPNNNSAQVRRDRIAFYKRDICKMFIDLASREAVNEHGKHNYAFPFAFQLPASLPTTMANLVSTDGGHCYIRYEIMADLKGRFAGTKSNKATINVMALPVPRKSFVPHIADPVIERLNCLDLGVISFGASIDDTRIGNGEELVIKLGCKNESATEIVSIEAAMIESVRWGKRDGYSNITSTVVARSKQFHTSESMVRKEKSEVKRILSQNKRSGNAEASNRELYEMINSGSNSLILTVPSTIRHDYAGACILVSHWVEMTVELRAFCTKSIKTTLVLNIGSPNIVQDALLENHTDHSMSSEQPLLPEGWDQRTTHTAPVAISTPNNTILGGTTTSSHEGIELNLESFTPKKSGHNVVSIKALISDMRISNNPFITVSNTLHDAAWNHLFSSLSPMDYCMIIRTIPSKFDQPDAALYVAQKIQDFTANHIIALLRVISRHMRIAALKKTLPLCGHDAVANKSIIYKELNPWERICVEDDYRKLTS